MKNFLSVTVKASVLAGMLLTSSYAHQSIAAKVGQHYELKFWAHNGFEDYKKEQFLGASAYDINAKMIKTGVDYSKANPAILTASSPAVVITNFDAGYWSKTDSGYVAKPAYEINGLVFDTLRSLKIGKTYFSYSPALANPLGLDFEVTALINPFNLKIGDILPVLVTYKGAPLKGAKFENQTDDLDVVTNEYGIAFIKIVSKGLNIIAARYEEPLLGNAQAKKLLIQSSISFTLE